MIIVVVWIQKEAEGANCRVCGLTPGSSVKLKCFILLSTFISVLCVCVRVSQSLPCRSRRCQCDFGWGFSLFLEAGSCLFWFHFSSLTQPRIKLLSNDSYSVQSDSRVFFFFFFRRLFGLMFYYINLLRHRDYYLSRSDLIPTFMCCSENIWCTANKVCVRVCAWSGVCHSVSVSEIISVREEEEENSSRRRDDGNWKKIKEREGKDCRQAFTGKHTWKQWNTHLASHLYTHLKIDMKTPWKVPEKILKIVPANTVNTPEKMHNK